MSSDFTKEMNDWTEHAYAKLAHAYDIRWKDGLDEFREPQSDIEETACLMVLSDIAAQDDVEGHALRVIEGKAEPRRVVLGLP